MLCLFILLSHLEPINLLIATKIFKCSCKRYKSYNNVYPFNHFELLLLRVFPTKLYRGKKQIARGCNFKKKLFSDRKK